MTDLITSLRAELPATNSNLATIVQSEVIDSFAETSYVTMQEAFSKIQSRPSCVSFMSDSELEESGALHGSISNEVAAVMVSEVMHELDTTILNELNKNVAVAIVKPRFSFNDITDSTASLEESVSANPNSDVMIVDPMALALMQSNPSAEYSPTGQSESNVMRRVKYVGTLDGKRVYVDTFADSNFALLFNRSDATIEVNYLCHVNPEQTGFTSAYKVSVTGVVGKLTFQ